MIFGSNPIYRFAVYNKKKMHSLGRSYNFDQPPVPVKECPVKILGQKAEIFFANPIFNTFALSVEQEVTVLKSYDDKLTFIKQILAENTLYTVKIVTEDSKTREVKLFEFDEFFPGYRTKGAISLKDDKPVFSCKYGTGQIVLQSNDPRKETEAVLAALDASGPVFAEVGNPIERTTVRIVKDLNNHKIVENGHIKGILIDARDRKSNEELGVYVKNVYPGSYCFVEDIRAGPAEVDLIGREGSTYQVRYKHFTGECTDKRVRKRMKGVIYDVKGGSFKFRQELGDERTTEFETVVVPKRVKITDESEIKGDQLKAIEYIKHCIEASDVEDEAVAALFKKYMQRIKECDSLGLFYLQYLVNRGALKESEIKSVLKHTSEKFAGLASDKLRDSKVVEMIFKVKKSLMGFKRLLAASEDKQGLMERNPEFLDYSIRYAYSEMECPRVVVETVIDKGFRHWLVYASLEEGNSRRNLYRRMSGMGFKKGEMKELFKAWLSFEESVGGNVEEVHKLASAYVERKAVSQRQ